MHPPEHYCYRRMQSYVLSYFIYSKYVICPVSFVKPRLQNVSFYHYFVTSPSFEVFLVFFDIYSEGVTPKYFLNATAKLLGFTIPTAYVT